MLRTESVEETSETKESSIVDHDQSTLEEHGDPPIQRNLANRKERKRTETMNSAFEDLRQHIPNVPVDTKLSKIKTLRLAISYIRYLMDVLEETKDGQPCSKKTFVVEMALQSDMKERKRRDQSVSTMLLFNCLLINQYGYQYRTFLIISVLSKTSTKARYHYLIQYFVVEMLLITTHSHSLCCIPQSVVRLERIININIIT